MSYATQSQLAQDVDFINRCNACAAKEISPASPTNPLTYVATNIWSLAASPGFDDKYEYAINTHHSRPGWDDAVISDGDILAAMQALLAAHPAEPEPTPPEPAP